MNLQICSSVAQQIVELVVSTGDTHAGMVLRRQAVLDGVVELVGADAGWWAWGRGTPDAGTIVPLAQLQFGFTQSQLEIMVESALDDEANRAFRLRVWKQMGGASRMTSTHRDIFSDAEWDASKMRHAMARAGLNAWLHSVRYSTNDTWSNFFLVRAAGRPDFDHADAAALDLVMAGVTWMHSNIEEYLAPSVFNGLTPRRKNVMLMLLDGAPRKAIAQKLGITEDTVGDHIKSIYSHFNVGSSTELASLFLRAR